MNQYFCVFVDFVDDGFYGRRNKFSVLRSSVKCTSEISVERPSERTAFSLSVSLCSVFPRSGVPRCDLMTRQILEPVSAFPEQRPLSARTLSVLCVSALEYKLPSEQTKL